MTHVSPEEALRVAALEIDDTLPRAKRGGPSKTEASYERHLMALKAAGEVRSWIAQPPAIELAHRCTYQADYEVVRHVHDMPVVEWHEVKGRKGGRPWYRDDGARVKAKVAARLLAASGVPLVVVWPKKGGGWAAEVVRP